MKKLIYTAVLSAILVATTACVTGRRSIELAVPGSPTAVPAASKGTVALASIADERLFENAPKSPSTPSIDGDVTKTGKDTLSTMIGRQRNGFGHAMGDIALAGGETVQGRVRALVEQGFRQRGYSPVAGNSGDATADISINKFWGWFTPGFASIDFEAELSTDIKVSHGGATSTITVKGYGKNSGQVASDANWQLAFSRAFEDFRKNLDSALSAAGL